MIELEQSPVDHDLYTSIDQLEPPVLLAGTMINNAADHEKYSINPHFLQKCIRVNDTCFKGIMLKPSKLLLNKYKNICSVPFDNPSVIDMYRNRLNMYGFSCDTCFKLLKKNIFPFDVSNLSMLCINSTVNQHNIHNICDTKPWYLQYFQPKIFLLLNR